MRMSMVLVAAVLPTIASATTVEWVQQGRLLDSTGTPISGEVSLLVCLYDDENATECTWDDDLADVVMDDGFYSVVLGADPSDPLDLDAFVTGEVWIGVTVVGSPELGRQKLASVPFASQADSVDGAHFPAVATTDSVHDIKAYVDRRLCEARNGAWSDGVGCEEPIKLGPSTLPASIDWAYDGGSCGVGWHVCTGPEYYEYVGIIRRLGCPSGHGFNGGWPATETEDRNQMFHGHSNSGLTGYASGPVKPAGGQLIRTQISNGTACMLSPNNSDEALPVWCCVNRSSNL